MKETRIKKKPRQYAGVSCQCGLLSLQRHHRVIHVAHAEQKGGGMVKLGPQACDDVPPHAHFLVDAAHQLGQPHKQGVRFFQQVIVYCPHPEIAMACSR